MKHTFVRRATTEDASEVIRMAEQFCAHQHKSFWPPAKEAVVFLAEGATSKSSGWWRCTPTWRAIRRSVICGSILGTAEKASAVSLIDAVKSYVGAAREIMLSVRRENVEARHFFQSCDFRRGKFLTLHLVTP